MYLCQYNEYSSVIVNSLGPSDAIWRWRSWSTLVQVMACCLTAPSHYLNQCWLIISEAQWHIRAIAQEMPQPSITKIHLKITYLKFHSNSPGANELIAPLTTVTSTWIHSTVHWVSNGRKMQMPPLIFTGNAGNLYRLRLGDIVRKQKPAAQGRRHTQDTV